MLSIGKVSTGAAAGAYYEEADDYYHQDRSPSAWQGEGAARLGLSGEVDAKRFQDLLDGKLPEGGQLHNATEGRRGGTDLTFSAPKSVSMQALIDAHELAVSRALVQAIRWRVVALRMDKSMGRCLMARCFDLPSFGG